MCEEHKHIGSEVGEDLDISGGNKLGVSLDDNSLKVNFPEGIDMESKEVIGVIGTIKEVFNKFMNCYKN